MFGTIHDLVKWLELSRENERCLLVGNDMLKSENAKLRELCKSMRCALVDFDDEVYLAALDKTLIDAGFDLQKLGIEVDDD